MQGIKKSQKNSLVPYVEKAGFDPGDFIWEGDTLAFRANPSYSYTVSTSGYGWVMEISPGGDRLIEETAALSWEGVVGSFVLWLRNLKVELEAPDLWEIASQNRQLGEVAASEELENTPFTEDEQQEISTQLKELEAYVKANYQLTATAVKLLETKIKYLEEASTRMGRKDWLNILYGRLFDLGFHVVANGEQLHDLFRFAWSLLGPLFGDQGSGLLPQ